MSESTPKKTKIETFTPKLSIRLSGHRLDPNFPLDFVKTWSPPEEPLEGLYFHDFFELGLCHEGSGVLIMGNKVFPYKKGDLCSIRQFDSHFHIGTKGIKTIWSFIFFDTAKLFKAPLYDPSLCDTSSFAEPNLSPILSGEKYPKLKETYMMLYNEFCAKEKGYKDVSTGLIIFYLTLLKRLKVSDIPLKLNSYSEDTNRINPALVFIGKNFREKITINELAGYCKMSGRNFTRRFTEAAGNSPMEYINELRIVTAKSDLLSSRKKIIEIAFDNGFGSVSNFGKAFKKYTGHSPRSYRNNKSVQILS